MSKISWLHLSDMHISSKNSYDQNFIHNALFDDLEKQISKYKISLNFVFFTGDVAFTASKQDYTLAIKFFENLCDRLSIAKDNVIIVPGNHDVNRYKVSKMLDDARNNLCNRNEINEVVENKQLFDNYLSRFDNYAEFLSLFYGKPYEINSDNYYFSEERKIGEVTFGIIGLNSAWSSYGGRHDCNNIYISEAQLNDATEKVKSTDIKIVLMHHPLHWLFEEDKADIENLLFKHPPIILHGHIHMADFQAVNSIRGEHVTIPAGAIYTDRRVSNCYNITTIDIDKEVIKILPRQYSDRRNKFFKDIDTLGNDDIDEFEVKLSDKMLISLKKAKRTYNRDSQMIKE